MTDWSDTVESLVDNYDEMTDDDQAEVDRLLVALGEGALPLANWMEQHSPQYLPAPAHIGPLIELLQRAMDRPTHAIVSMPPRHGKTTTVDLALACAIDTRPALLNAYVTYSQRAANTQARKIRRSVLATGTELADDTTAVHEFRTSAGGGLISTGIGGALTGYGVDGLLIVDDPIKNRKLANSLLERDATEEWYSEVAYTRLQDRASAIIITTRWHEDDLPGRLVAADDSPYELLSLPAAHDGNFQPVDQEVLLHGTVEDVHALWPDKYPVERLRRIARNVGPYGFESLYQQRPRPIGGKLFKDASYYEQLPDGGFTVVIVCDPAGSEDPSADYTAVGAFAFARVNNELWGFVLEIARWQLTPEAVTPHLIEFQDKWGVPIHIEASRDGKEIIRTMEKIDKTINIVEMPPWGSKYRRAQPLVRAWKDQRFLVPMQQRPWKPDYLGELHAFTGINDRRDDQVDISSYAWLIADNQLAPMVIRTVGKSRIVQPDRRAVIKTLGHKRRRMG